MNPDQILTEADRCVKCGLCLPHCPTYQITRDEGNSPRGRIALMQALISHTVESPNLHRHLDLCLGCQACESACPSGVKYGQLIDSVRALQPNRISRFQRMRLSLLTRLPYLRLSRTLLRFYQQSGLKSAMRRIGGSRFRRLDNLLPPLAKPSRLKPVYRGSGDINGRIVLFTGCIGGITDQPALLAAIRLLTRLDFEVVVPPTQRCCGALHQHNGQPGSARQLAAENSRLLNALQPDAIVYTASGCGAQLNEYGRLGHALNAPVKDICSFLSAVETVQQLPFAPFGRRVLIHQPCSSRRIAGAGASVIKLLNLIPDIDLRSLPDSGCCGAAGSYLLLQPDMADRLRQSTLDRIREHECQILITSNTGCALHLTAGLEQMNRGIELMHPVQLLARQLQ